MKQQRLDGLADGIFSIVMTLLVIELKVPIFKGGEPNDMVLVNSLMGMWNIFISMVLSFALLFTYWRAHHFISSVYAKNLTVGLANINALFFFLITLVPFVAHFLGEYPHSHIAITLYGVTVMAIGFTLFYMRWYVETSKDIETSVITKADRRSGYIRILFPVFSAAMAILLSYWNQTISMLLFTVAIIFNLMPASSNRIHRWLDLIFSDDNELIKGNYENPMKDMLNNEEFVCVPKSAVFDHHRFKEADAEVRDLISRKHVEKTQSGSEKKDVVRKRASDLLKKEKHIEKEIAKEIEEDIREGKVEEIVVKKDI
jgi:uncharacterized membrane protein